MRTVNKFKWNIDFGKIFLGIPCYFIATMLVLHLTFNQAILLLLLWFVGSISIKYTWEKERRYYR